ncbi:hypothetical protein SS50377_23909 [Spironucleus salmonicida]|uniref:Uncharacterized protein n=1 Tax=Spironucleus salmonicida TaxID=348837 RepID=A0A9P8LSX1_9EUKA|nr:hypothetical protein SS50377_23909 [Spironucleus salmonicida]
MFKPITHIPGISNVSQNLTDFVMQDYNQVLDKFEEINEFGLNIFYPNAGETFSPLPE